MRATIWSYLCVCNCMIVPICAYIWSYFCVHIYGLTCVCDCMVIPVCANSWSYLCMQLYGHTFVWKSMVIPMCMRVDVLFAWIATGSFCQVPAFLAQAVHKSFSAYFLHVWISIRHKLVPASLSALSKSCKICFIACVSSFSSSSTIPGSLRIYPICLPASSLSNISLHVFFLFDPFHRSLQAYSFPGPRARVLFSYTIPSCKQALLPWPPSIPGWGLGRGPVSVWRVAGRRATGRPDATAYGAHVCYRYGGTSWLEGLQRLRFLEASLGAVRRADSRARKRAHTWHTGRFVVRTYFNYCTKDM